MREKALRLYPPPSVELEAGTIYEGDAIPSAPHVQRTRAMPHVVLNMVSSADGRSTVSGKASGLGSAVDRTTMRTLRGKADAVMVGAGTLRAERLSLGTDLGTALGTDRAPLAIVISKTLEIPLEQHLALDAGQDLLILAPECQGEDPHARARTRVMRGPSTPSGEVDLARALRMLKREEGVDLLLVEGGPTLNHALISASLVDELFVTVAPKLLGDAEKPAVLAGPLPKPHGLRLLSAYLAEDELFLRYALRSSTNFA